MQFLWLNNAAHWLSNTLTFRNYTLSCVRKPISKIYFNLRIARVIQKSQHCRWRQQVVGDGRKCTEVHRWCAYDWLYWTKFSKSILDWMNLEWKLVQACDMTLFGWKQRLNSYRQTMFVDDYCLKTIFTLCRTLLLCQHGLHASNIWANCVD